MEPAIPVVFRVFREGDVIALFPGEAAAVGQPHLCLSYVHVGQHSAADPGEVVRITRPAAPREYAALKRELESAPYHYRLRVIKRVGGRYHQMREAALA